MTGASLYFCDETLEVMLRVIDCQAIDIQKEILLLPVHAVLHRIHKKGMLSPQGTSGDYFHGIVSHCPCIFLRCTRVCMCINLHALCT